MIPELDVVTMASKSPQKVTHLHHCVVQLTRPASGDEILEVFRAVPRIAFIRAAGAYQVDNQAIVVPETIDAIRALSGIEPDGERSMERTDASLGVLRTFV